MNKLTIGSINCNKAINDKRHQIELALEVENIDILCLQEIGNLNRETLFGFNKNYLVHISEYDYPTLKSGNAILVSRKINCKIERIPSTGEFIFITIKAENTTIALCNAYYTNHTRREWKPDEFGKHIIEEMNKTKCKTRIIVGDLNAYGKNTERKKRNRNKELLNELGGSFIDTHLYNNQNDKDITTHETRYKRTEQT